MRITLRHIADKMNLTPATVSRALNNHPRISSETKRLVLETCKELNYRTDRIASSLRTGKSHTIGVIIPSARMNFFGSVVHGIETVASKKGYHTLIFQSEELAEFEINGIEAFMGARVDGILASLAKGSTNFLHYTELKKRNVPLVLFDRTIDSLHIPSVIIDDYKGGFIATTHLIEQGYKRIAHLDGPQHFQTFKNRYRGYRDALEAHNLPFDKSLLFKGDLSIERGKLAADYFLGLSSIPDAVFAVEDFSALGLIKGFKERKIKIPDEMGVIGFANEDFDEHITPTLSSIHQQTVEMGQEAFTLLLDIIEGRYSKSGPPSKIVLNPIPIFRESTDRYHKKQDNP